eukprot:TRINITY_DN25065_c0_g6_i1.p1 TRINITY_DN25065_c0_g6~~TRINITY_DN25065_c0_g6_i1.p1  ORF type:complete len:512 (-),score=66.39 TRINITY_DN25065_c0_g6_i1:52-1587(-)
MLKCCKARAGNRSVDDFDSLADSTRLLLQSAERTVIPTWARGEELPSWACDPKLRSVSDREGELLTLDRTCGPAVYYGFGALLGLTYFLTVLPIVGYYIARCPDDDNGFAVYPAGLLWVLFFAPMAVIVWVCQWKCSTYVVVPMLDTISTRGTEETGSTFDILGLPVSASRFLSYRVWFLVLSTLSMMNLLDNMTNALFMAQTYATKNCAGYNEIQSLWYHTMSSSFFAPIMKFTSLDFADICLVCYALQLFVQPLFALAMSYPVSGHPDYQIHNSDKEEVKFKTLSDSSSENDKTTYDTAAMILAEANRMELITSQDMKYRLCSTAEMFRELSDGNADMRLKASCLEMQLAAIARGNARFTMKGLLQNAIQVNLQVSFIALSKSMLSGGIDPMNALSVCFTVFGMLGDVPDMLAILKFARMKPPPTTHMALGQTRDFLDDLKEESEANAYRVNALRKRTKRLFFYMFVYVLLAMYAGVKLFMAVFVCEDGVWNMTVWKGHYGCVLREQPS